MSPCIEIKNNKGENLIKRIILLLGILLMGSILFACAPKVVPVTPVEEKPAEVAASVAREGWEVEWEKLIKAAKKEGLIRVYAGAVPPEVTQWMSEAFKHKFGIDMDITTGPPGQQVQRVFSERRANLFLADVWIGGPTNNILELKPAGFTERLDGIIFHPDVVDPKLWRAGGDGPFFDRDHHVAVGMNSMTPMVARNTGLIKEEEIRSLKDLLDPKWRNKIGVGTPTAGGSKTVLIWVYRIMGHEFMSKLVKEQNPTVIPDKRMLVEWLAREKMHLVIGAVSDQVAAFKSIGAAVEYIPVDEGILILYGANTISLLKKAPHPNAAKLLMNWLLTRDANAQWAKLHDLVSRRVDVESDWIDPMRRFQPGMKYHITDEDFYLTQEEDVKAIIAIFKPLM